jgi:hypothetical protein
MLQQHKNIQHLMFCYELNVTQYLPGHSLANDMLLNSVTSFISVGLQQQHAPANMHPNASQNCCCNLILLEPK